MPKPTEPFSSLVDFATVEITTGTSNATIYYTTDGSEPTTSSTEYNDTFDLGLGDHVVKAMCVRNNFQDSETAVEAFIVEETASAPSITTQPVSQAVDTCGTATFSVAVNGTDPLSYQWYKDGTLLAGETEPELEIAAAALSNAGNYTVTAGPIVVTDPGGGLKGGPPAWGSGFLPATLGFEEIDDEIKIEPITEPVSIQSGIFLLNYFGFGGNCVSLVVSNKPL